MKRIVTLIISMFLITGILCFLPKKQEYSVYIPDALGTVSEIKIYSENNKVLSECQDYIYKMDSLFSLTNTESELYKLNKDKTAILSTETSELLNISLSYADNSTFNPFCGSLIELWENAKQKQLLPSSEDISIAKSYSYPFSLEIQGNTAVLKNPNQKIDLGAIAKGYITDGLVKILDSQNIDSALIYLGGNVYAKGLNKNNRPWKIGISNPDNDGEYIGIISASDISVITSGDYERYFEIDGKKYHHILDPKTGYPADSGLRSVTIISPNAALGDMLSTKCFVAGFEASKEILDQFGVYGIFITNDKKIYFSEGLKDIFTYDSDEYIYEAF